MKQYAAVFYEQHHNILNKQCVLDFGEIYMPFDLHLLE